MLITKSVEILIKGNACNYYRDNNIEVEFNKKNTLPIEKLNPNSHIKIDAVCDVCNKKVNIEYRRYIKSLNNGGYYTCSSKCGINKIRKTNTEKYGVMSYVESDDFKKKNKNTHKEKWGENHFRMSEKWKNERKGIESEKRKKTIFDKFKNRNPSIIQQTKDEFICQCNIHGEYIIPKSIFSNRKINNSETCVICNPISQNISGKEIKLKNMICENYSGEVLSNYRIGRKEIDIYIPELNLGIEFNGLRWHSELFNNSYNLLDKSNYMLKNGIRIIHIFEDDYDTKFEIVKSIILNSINMTSKVIYARQTTVKKIIDTQILRKFLNENHLQGYHQSKFNYGLYYNNELVSVMTFTHLRKILRHNNEGYELLRFCNKLNYRIVGGASKLLKTFINDVDPNYILSYSDRTWANGSMYQKMGFKYMYTTKPNYWYVNNGIRESRLKYQKHKLVQMGYDKDKTEKQITGELGIYRIYGCGNDVYEMKL
jgi:hypothetical protein